ncbi:MBOAT family O-acyltransferase [Bryobacter aggregatus]|uniref:MBOAT family O-acyltransferase n=1 Tax=Bryobacter aggregatus TaxID=360054 RepID=UPI0004E21B8E|nr:MBOAT family O-acyltransferase [Bryobacter aggregatus]
MLNTSSAYFVFLAAVFFLYWMVARWRTPVLAVVLAANYFFYARWDLFYLALIPAASLVDYLCGLGMQASQRVWWRRTLLGLSLATNLGILISLKYMPAWDKNWKWVLPLGLSFYCFQALSYTIDVYRRDAKATPSLLAHFTAVSFFPAILAGPITRVTNLIPQLEKPKKLAASDGGRALFLIGLGAMKKLLVADYLAENLVNRVFDFPKLYSGLEVLAGVYGYALQLYFDFSGYSDIAIGSALLLGLKLPQNFNMPYASVNISDFWRRWHISLSSWLRDYVYFSFPGLRGKLMPYVALIFTMVIGGFWHGPTWNFVLWGTLHGVGLAACRGWQAWRGAQKWDSALSRALATFWTVQFVCFCWIFFRASSFENAVDILTQIGSLTMSTANLTGALLTIGAIAIAGHYAPKKWLEESEVLFGRAPFVVQAALLAMLAMSIKYVAATGNAPFVYSQF